MNKVSGFITKFQNLILIFYPFLLGKDGSHTRYIVTIAFVILGIFNLLINKKVHSIPKKILVSFLGCIVFLSLSLIKLDKVYLNEIIIYYKEIVVCFLFVIMLTQLDINEKLKKCMLPLISVFSLYPLYRAMREWSLMGFDTEIRLTGNHGPSIFAVELGLFAIVSLIVILYYKKIYLKVIALIAGVLCLFCILGTQTRSVIIILPLIIIGILVIRNFKVGILASLALCAVLVFFVSLNPDEYLRRFDTENSDGGASNNIRMEIYKRSVKVGIESKFMGIGFFNYRRASLAMEPYYTDYIDYDKKEYKEEKVPEPLNVKAMACVAEHTHSNFLEVLITQGIFAFLFYIFLIFSLFWELIKKFRQELEEINKGIILAALAALLFVTLNGIIDVNLYMNQVNQLLALLLGIAFSKNHRERGRENEIISGNNNI